MTRFRNEPALTVPESAEPGPGSSDRAATWAAIYLGVSNAALATVIPVVIGILSDNLALGTERAGFVVSANLTGSLLGCLAGFVLVKRVALSRLALISLSALILTNLLTPLASTFSAMLAIRFLSGCCDGVLGGAIYVVMGKSAQPARALAIYCAGQMVVGAAGLAAIPFMVQRFGWQSLFILLAAISIPGLFLCGRLGVLLSGDGDSSAKSRLNRRTWLSLLGIFIAFSAFSSLWAYLEQIGRAAQLSTSVIAWSLSMSAIAGFGASTTVAVIAKRVSVRAGLLVSLAFLVIAAALLVVSVTPLAFFIACCLLILAWNTAYPFQFQIFTINDPQGSALALTGAATGGGLALGPAIGGLLFTHGGVFGLALVSFGLTALSFMIMGLRRQRLSGASGPLKAAPGDAS